MSVWFNHYADLIPVAFVLGFYVSLVVTRWWDQYQTLPWPDTLAMYVSASINGQVSQYVRFLPHVLYVFMNT